MRRYSHYIALYSAGYDQGTLDLLEIAMKEENAKFLWKVFKDEGIEITYETMPDNIDQIVEDIRTLDRLQWMKLKNEVDTEYIEVEYQLSDKKDFSNIISSYVNKKDIAIPKDVFTKMMDNTHIMFVRMRFNIHGIKSEWVKIGAI